MTGQLVSIDNVNKVTALEGGGGGVEVYTTEYYTTEYFWGRGY